MVSLILSSQIKVDFSRQNYGIDYVISSKSKEDFLQPSTFQSIAKQKDRTAQ